MISSSLVKSLIFEHDVLNRDPVSKPIGIMLIMLAATFANFVIKMVIFQNEFRSTFVGM